MTLKFDEQERRRRDAAHAKRTAIGPLRYDVVTDRWLERLPNGRWRPIAGLIALDGDYCPIDEIPFE